MSTWKSDLTDLNQAWVYFLCASLDWPSLHSVEKETSSSPFTAHPSRELSSVPKYFKDINTQ